jgi:hypothetical protein
MYFVFIVRAQQAKQRVRRLVGERKADDDDVRDGLLAVVDRLARGCDAVDLPRRDTDAGVDLLDDDRLVLDDENLAGVGEGLALVLALGDGAQVDYAADLLVEDVLLEGLNDVVAYAELGDLQDHLPARFRRQHDDGDGLERRLGLELGQHFHAVHDGHRHVQEDQVGQLLGGHGQPLDAVRSLENLNIVTFERLLDDDSHGSRIVNGENL